MACDSTKASKYSMLSNSYSKETPGTEIMAEAPPEYSAHETNEDSNSQDRPIVIPRKSPFLEVFHI